MNKNVGGNDRKARLVVGSFFLVLGITGYIGAAPLAFGPFPQALTSIVVGVVGAILLTTSITQKCPINSALGKNTCQSATTESG